jgi:type IV secretory pathway VirB6-like protein
VPLLVASIAVVRHVGRSDEYQRLITYRALATAFAVTMVTSVFIALVTSAGFTVNPGLTSWVPFLVGMFTWGALGCFGSKRQ